MDIKTRKALTRLEQAIRRPTVQYPTVANHGLLLSALEQVYPVLVDGNIVFTLGATGLADDVFVP